MDESDAPGAPVDLWYAPTPNGWKVTIFLEESGLPYRILPIRLKQGAQHEPAFRAISPGGKMPALIDHGPPRVTVFESGAILLHLAEKTGRFLPCDAQVRARTIAWLFWQMAALGPTLGQHGHFRLYADEKIPYAIARFHDETIRLYGVLETQLAGGGPFIVGDDYTIADMACFPWIMTHKAQGIDLAAFPAVAAWFAMMRVRPGVQAGLAAGQHLFADGDALRSKTA